MALYNAKHEGCVLVAVKELGLASVEEVKDFLKQHFAIDLETKEVFLILEKWKARDVFVIDLTHDAKRYKLAKIPAPFQSAKIENVKGFRLKDFKNAMDTINKEFPMIDTQIEHTKGFIGNYKFYDVIIEAVDPILGGSPSDDGILKVHRNNDEPVVTPAQLRGWFRSNGRLIGLNANAHSWLAYSMATPVNGTPKLIEIKAPIVVMGRGRGLQTYEAFAPGTQLGFRVGIPENIGIKGDRKTALEQFFGYTAVSPVRGLGSNPYYQGGRTKLVQIKEVA